jgi:CheY-like chemotaxis protein
MTAENGKEAVEAHKANPAHIILMDVNMPLLDGVEATQEIRKFDNNVPIVAVTANSLNEEKVRCLSAGMSEFTTKPVNKEKLQNILSTYLTKEPQKELKKMHTESEIVLVNAELLQGFITDLGKEKVIEFINLYKKDAPGFIQKLETNVDLETASHTLAGMSENLNFIALGKKSREILQIVKSKEPNDTLEGLIKELAPLYENTLNEANKIIGESAPS